jgi:hypothetical protein
MKLWERVIEHRLRKLTTVSKISLILCLGGPLWRRFSCKTIYRETSGTREGLTYDIY